MLAQTKPDLERKIGVTIANILSPDYQFSDLRFNSTDGQRHYRIRITQPRIARFCRIKTESGNMLFFFVMLPAHISDPERL
ncbi:hypothetical protein [Serratia proteamaculans]|uniref:Uncharacterized protein n=1 Tax=Serratia proteamaculans TaxID=28151 RepID=A0A5Q2VDB3_SERPR|nr:hypothetical protein [Serratia proteamaculans]QGH62019.1 hypothetical protein GHV41_14815 [Serratia proteamaculans]